MKLTYETAARGIVDLLENGPGVRDDGFFSARREDSGATAADETLEHLLTTAQHAYELRKAEALGRLLVFIARRPDIRATHANRLINLASRFTYQQLLWLGLFNVAEDPQGLPDWSSSGTANVSETLFVDEVGELAALNLIKRRDNARITDFGQLNPRYLQTALDGKLLVEGMELHEAEAEDAVALWSVIQLLGVLDADAGTTTVDVIGLPGSDPDSRVKINYRVMKRAPLPPLTRPSDVEDESPPDVETQGESNG